MIGLGICGFGALNWDSKLSLRLGGFGGHLAYTALVRTARTPSFQRTQ